MILPLLLQGDPGLAAWRAPDSHGQRCVSCHSPDGIELTEFGFSRENILRRASRHLPATESEAIVEMLRRRPAGADSAKDRPLQPGGSVLSGVTAAQRDNAFLATLPAVVPTLTTGRVATEADALKVRDEVIRVDLTKLRIGIPFNFLSEDSFHGAEHRSIANWIPDVPIHVPSDEVMDRYLADPSDENLRRIDAEVRPQAQTASTPAEALAVAKYRSLLVLQHRLRTGRLTPLTLPKGLGVNQNPFWDVADFARLGAQTELASLRLPPEIEESKRSGPTFEDQMKSLRLPWFWLGWMLDPSLQTSGLSGETQRGDYFVSFLWKDGPYPAHLAFMISKKLIEQGFNPRLWNNARINQHYEFSMSGFVMGDELQSLTLDGEYRKKFVILATNALRTGLFLARKSVRETGEALHPESQANQVRLALAYLKKVDPWPTDAPLAKDLLARLAKAKPLR